jgi:hypothetical protein
VVRITDLRHPRVGLAHSTFHVIDAASRTSATIGNWTSQPAEDRIEAGHNFIVLSISSVHRVCFSTAIMRVAAMPATYVYSRLPRLQQ